MPIIVASIASVIIVYTSLSAIILRLPASDCKMEFCTKQQRFWRLALYNILYYIYYYRRPPGMDKSGNIVYDRKTWSISRFKRPSRAFRAQQYNYIQMAAKRHYGNLVHLFGYDFSLYSLFMRPFVFKKLYYSKHYSFIQYILYIYIILALIIEQQRLLVKIMICPVASI